MTMSKIRFPHDSGELANNSIPSVWSWSRVAAFSSLALGSLATNPALSYTLHFDTVGHTNPVISLPTEEIVGWINDEDSELGQFLSFLDAQIAHAKWIEPADEVQLDRLTKLLANVKV